MTLLNWLTVLGSGIAAIAPMLLHIIPAPYNAVASAIITAASSYLHLHTPAPIE